MVCNACLVVVSCSDFVIDEQGLSVPSGFLCYTGIGRKWGMGQEEGGMWDVGWGEGGMWGRKRVGCGVGRASRRRQFLVTIHSTLFPHLTSLVLCSFSMYRPGLVDQEPVSHSSPRPS